MECLAYQTLGASVYVSFACNNSFILWLDKGESEINCSQSLVSINANGQWCLKLQLDEFKCECME